MNESGSSPQTDSCLVWGWEESLVYPSARLDVDSGTGDKEAPEDEDEEVTLNLRSLCNSSGDAEEEAEEIFPSKAD